MPIEFAAVGIVTISLKLNLPEGYHLEEAPAPLSAQLPDGGLAMRYVAGESGGFITVSCRVNTNGLFFPVESYQIVKQFYDALVGKCNEMLVISKK